MGDDEWLAGRFEANRVHLQAVAYRMPGPSSEADDALQEPWLPLSPSGADGVENRSDWLTTVVARVCLDALRSRPSRREELLDRRDLEFPACVGTENDPDVVLRADSAVVDAGASPELLGA
jgi:RNA polymerase sigma-70 factor (ECF subfamily)